MPVAGTVTFTLIVQLLLGASVPFENDKEPLPATDAKVGVPQPDVDAFVGFAMTIAPGFAGIVGRKSSKCKPVSVTGVGFVNVNVNVEMPPTLVGSGLKFFAIVTAEESRI